MAVYPICCECGLRRSACVDLVAHKRFVKWRADVRFTRHSPRLRKTFRTQELADIQQRQWYTDYERGLLLPQDKVVRTAFPAVADEWLLMAIGQGRIKNANRSEKSRVEMFKLLWSKVLINELTFEHGESWLNQRIKEGKAVATINRDMKPLKWIMDYAVKKGYIKENPFKELKELKNPNIRIRWMTEAEISHLVDTVHKLGDKALIDIIELGLNTGFRKGNLERLTSRDISTNRITALKTKSGKAYDVPIAPAIVPTLQRLIAEHSTGPLLNTIKLDRRFRTAVKEAGFYKEKGDPDNITIHTLRHTFAALYLKRGGDIHKLSKLLGHASIAITDKVYGHICPKEIDAQAPLISTPIKRSAAQVIENLKTGV